MPRRPKTVVPRRDRRRIHASPPRPVAMHRRPGRWSLAALGATTALALAAVVVLAAQSATSGGNEPRGGWFAPGNALTVAVLAALLGLWLLTYWFPRRRLERNLSLAVGGGLTVVTVGLALPTYSATPTSEAPFWAPLAWTLALFVGNVESPFGGPLPLALQAARLTALLTTFLGISAILLHTFREQYDRVVARWSRSVVLVTGVDETSVPFIRLVLLSVAPGARVVVLERDAGNRFVPELRRLGACVVVGDPVDAEAVVDLISAPPILGRRIVLRSAYLLGERPTDSIATADILGSLVTTRGLSGQRPRVIVRLDSPWQAEDWRRRQIASRPGVMTDTVGRYQVTAQEILDHALAHGHARVVLVGASALTLAVLDELEQHRREQAVLGEAMRLDVVVLDPRSEVVRHDHELHQAYYGRGVDRLPIRYVASEPTAEAVCEATREDPARCLVVVAVPPSDAAVELGHRLAARLREPSLLLWVDGIAGIGTNEVFGNARPFGLTLVATHDGYPCLPEPGWDRIARRLHDDYLKSRSGTARWPSQRPWEELSEFYRESNRRRVAVALDIAVRASRVWTRPAWSAGEPHLLTPVEVDRCAHLEHESWVRYYEGAGWRHGPTRREDSSWRLRHPQLVEWDRLDEEARNYTARSVGTALQFLDALGYHPFLDGAVWSPYVRTGEVTAERVDEAWKWQDQAGSVLTARPGDWRVSDATRTWSVADEPFRRTYRHVHGDVYERCGVVWVRPAVDEEVVTTREGGVVAHAGQYVVRDRRSYEWVVSSEHLAAHYLAADTDGDAERGEPH